MRHVLLWRRAAKQGRLRMLQWLSMNAPIEFYKLNDIVRDCSGVVNVSAAGGHTDVLKWLHQHRE